MVYFLHGDAFPPGKKYSPAQYSRDPRVAGFYRSKHIVGSFIEINDTLQITREQGFPEELLFEVHQKNPFTVEQFADRDFSFEKPDMRLYQPAPVRVHFVQNIDGKWLFWGEAHILEQTIHATRKVTSGVFRITKIYPPDIQEVITKAQAPEGKSYL